MQSLGLKEQIGKLLALQAVDSQIYALKEEKEAKPQEIKSLDELFAQKKEDLKLSEKKLQDLLSQRKAKELELASKEESAKKLQAQLYQLKTNKEYSTMLKEIEGVKADASLLEDEILVVFENIDKEKVNIEKEKEPFSKEEEKYKQEKNNTQTRLKEIEERLNQLEAQRKSVALGIERRILSQYERILNNREGLAIVRVHNNACQGCNMSLPPQVINMIKMYERIISCELCQRILYLEEDIPGI
jgi:predicted  nucleic acid-binding Zn-ribbon protein